MSERSDRLIRLPEVQRVTGLSRQSIYRAEAAGRFPLRRRVGRRAVAWSEGEVQAWVRGLDLASQSR